MYIQMTEEEVRRDVRLAKYPSSQVEILADINDVTKAVIRRVLDGASWDAATGKRGAASVRKLSVAEKRKWTSGEVRRMLAMRAKGLTKKEIACRFDVSESAIKTALRSARKKERPLATLQHRER